MIQPGRSAPGRYADRSNAARGQDLLHCVLDALPVGIGLFEIEPDEFRFRAGNRQFARVLRLDGMPANGDTLPEVFVRGESAAVRKLFDAVRAGRDPQSYFAAEDHEGPIQRIWNIDAYPVFSGGRLTHIMVMAEETAEKLESRRRRQLETDRLREKADQLAELEEAKSEFLRLASHELRGPAAMLGGYLSMMEEEALGPIPKRLRPILPLLKAKAAQINMLANEMVEAARLEDGQLQLKRRTVDLREVVRRSIVAASAVTARHRMRFDDRAAGPVTVAGDVMRLEIIIGNLLDNAIKYSHNGGDITVQLSIAGKLAIVSVSDMGIGIAAEDMNRLFIRFSRIAPSPDVPGTGLGLYLARELARLHGGDIVAVSKLGEGSEFTLSLPLESSTKQPQPT